MAHTKSSGASKYGRDSRPKYLGVKKHDGEKVQIGDIIIRQRGSKFYPGVGVKQGGDDTLFAEKEGLVKFAAKRKVRFDGSRTSVTTVAVVTAHGVSF